MDLRREGSLSPSPFVCRDDFPKVSDRWRGTGEIGVSVVQDRDGESWQLAKMHFRERDCGPSSIGPTVISFLARRSPLSTVGPSLHPAFSLRSLQEMSDPERGRHTEREER